MTNKLRAKIAKALINQESKASNFARLAVQGNCSLTSGIANGFRSDWELNHKAHALEAVHRCAELREMLHGRRAVSLWSSDFKEWA